MIEINEKHAQKLEVKNLIVESKKFHHAVAPSHVLRAVRTININVSANSEKRKNGKKLQLFYVFLGIYKL